MPVVKRNLTLTETEQHILLDSCHDETSTKTSRNTPWYHIKLCLPRGVWEIAASRLPTAAKIGNLFSKSVFFFAAVEKKGGVWSRQPRDTSLSSWSFSEISKGLLLLSWTVLWQGFWMRDLVKFTNFASFWPSETIEAMYCWWVERCLVSKPLFARFHCIPMCCRVSSITSISSWNRIQQGTCFLNFLRCHDWFLGSKHDLGADWMEISSKSPAIRLAKTNMAPENRPSSKERSFPTTIFQWRTVSFRGGTRFGSILLGFGSNSVGFIPVDASPNGDFESTSTIQEVFVGRLDFVHHFFVSVILLMVQESGVHQLRLVAYLNIYKVFIHPRGLHTNLLSYFVWRVKV